jgi:hypothetical protein
MSRIVTVLLVSMAAGCGAFPVSEAECRPASWRSRGYDDGYFGHLPQDMRLAQGCSRCGVTVDEKEYMAGWRDGYDEWDRLMGSFHRRRF